MVTLTAPPEPTLCPECGGAGTTEHNVLGMIVERHCEADGCDDGIVR